MMGYTGSNVDSSSLWGISLMREDKLEHKIIGFFVNLIGDIWQNIYKYILCAQFLHHNSLPFVLV